jgi:hypothetical protein
MYFEKRKNVRAGVFGPGLTMDPHKVRTGLCGLQARASAGDCIRPVPAAGVIAVALERNLYVIAEVLHTEMPRERLS